MKRNLPYATQPSPPPPPPSPNPKPKQGNSREVHAKKVSWDKCNRKGCKAHKEEKRRNETVRTRLGREGDKKLQEWGSGEESEVDDEGTLQWADMLQQRHIAWEKIRLQDETIQKQQEMIKQQRIAIEVGTTTIAMLKPQWQAEEGINKRLRKELRRTGRFLSELGR